MKKRIEDYLVKLSDSDRKTLASYSDLCDGLNACLGNAYEIVVHSLGKGDRFILRIVNGEYSGRSVDDEHDQLSVQAVEQLDALRKQGDKPVLVNFSLGDGGDVIKSASIGILGDGAKLIGMICLNFHMNAPFSSIIETFSPPGFLSAINSVNHSNDERNYDSTIYETVRNAQASVINDPGIPSKFKRKEIIRLLSDMGVFNVKKGVSICAEVLGVTITTIYMHIRNLDTVNGKPSQDE